MLNFNEMSKRDAASISFLWGGVCGIFIVIGVFGMLVGGAL